MYLKAKFCAGFACLALFSATLAPCAAAEPSLWDRIKSTGSDLYQSAKAATPGVITAGKDLASDAADKASDFYDAAKEKAPEVLDSAKAGLESAGEQFSQFRANQQDQFWDWFDNQTTSSSNTTNLTPDTSTTTSAAPDAPTPPPSSPDISATPTTPPSGFYEIDDTYYYYDATANTLQPVNPADEPNSDQSTNNVAMFTPSTDADTLPQEEYSSSFYINYLRMLIIAGAFLHFCNHCRHHNNAQHNRFT